MGEPKGHARHLMVVRSQARWAGAVLVVVIASACSGASHPATSTPPTSRAVTPAAAYDPGRLVGRWIVHGAPGDAGPLILADQLTLSRPCGTVDGDWDASTSGLFVAGVFGADNGCTNRGGPPVVPWLAKAVAFRPDGHTDFALLDQTGRVVARLTPGNRNENWPAMTSIRRQRLAAPAVMPVGVTQASLNRVLGKWHVAGANPRSYVQFTPNDTYEGSDGCNRVAGRYEVGPRGEVIATQGPQTLVGCNNSQLPDWVVESSRLGIRDDRLVFVDHRGRILGEADRM